MGEKKWVVLTRVSPYDAPQFAVPNVTINGKPVCEWCDAGPDEPAHLCVWKVAASMATMEDE